MSAEELQAIYYQLQQELDESVAKTEASLEQLGLMLDEQNKSFDADNGTFQSPLIEKAIDDGYIPVVFYMGRTELGEYKYTIGYVSDEGVTENIITLNPVKKSRNKRRKK